MALADFFDGKVEQEEFTQSVAVDAGYTGGYIPVWYRNLITRKAKTQTFTFTGCSYSDAHSTGSVEVTDIGGATYTVPLDPSFTDSSSGSAVFETESVRVRRRRISYHLWEVVVSRTGSAYYNNNMLWINGPSWM